MAKGDGFTIVEVMIFLAISGALMTMAIIGSGSMARLSRFSDSVNSLQSYLQGQYEQVQTGVNGRTTSSSCGGTSQAGTSSCLLVGRVVTFTTGATTAGKVRYVRAPGAANIPDTTNIYDQISKIVPDVTTEAEESFDLPWGASIQEATRSTNKILATDPVKTSRAYINSIAFLRGPNSSQIVTYYFYATTTAAADVKAGLVEAIKVANVPKSVQATVSLCVWNTLDWTSTSTPVAAVLMGDGRGSAGITTKFEPLRGTTEICS